MKYDSTLFMQDFFDISLSFPQNSYVLYVVFLGLVHLDKNPAFRHLLLIKLPQVVKYERCMLFVIWYVNSAFLLLSQSLYFIGSNKTLTSMQLIYEAF